MKLSDSDAEGFIEKLLPELQKYGVTLFEIQGLKLTLGPAPVQPAAPMSPSEVLRLRAELEKDAAADRCACGHAVFQHTNGLCVVGCSVDKCLPDDVAQ